MAWKDILGNAVKARGLRLFRVTSELNAASVAATKPLLCSIRRGKRPVPCRNRRETLNDRRVRQNHASGRSELFKSDVPLENDPLECIVAQPRLKNARKCATDRLERLPWIFVPMKMVLPRVSSYHSSFPLALTPLSPFSVIGNAN